MNYTKAQKEAIHNYLAKCVKNNYHCQHCALNHDGICFFAFECIVNDMMYFKEDDNKYRCSICFEENCNNCTEGDNYYDC